MTLKIEINKKIQEEIKYERYNHPSPLVQRRMEALWLKSHDLPHSQIAKLVGVNENTIREYFQLYNEGGLDKLKEINYYKPESKLNMHISSLEAFFKTNPPASINEAQNIIEEITGIKRSETQIREFLKKNSICVTAKRA